MNRRKQAAAAARQAGFTLVETMVTLVVSAIVIAGLFQMFNTLHKWSITTGVKAEQQQNARIGLETFTRDVEMAGYHTTNYGDVNKANLAITYAAADAIEMDQQRLNIVDNNLAAATYEPRLVFYHLATDATTGNQNLYRQIRTEPGLARPDELVAENVSAFTLAYFDKNNAPVAGLPLQYVAGAPPPAALKSIRRINVTLTTTTSRGRYDVPIGTLNPVYTLTASVMPQNMENPEATGDLAPPAVPANLNVVDSRSCSGKLLARWTANSELDLAGYVVFYGPTSKRVYPVSGLADKNNPAITLNPADLAITKLADTVGAPNTYPIEVAAYDSSGNYSARSAAIAAHPSPDVTAFVSPFPVPPATVAASANDTTVNPAKPSPPTALSVAPGGENELIVSWQPPTDGSVTAGYRLYRSTTPFADAAHIADAAQIADETTLPAGTASYTDNDHGAGLEGCATYYYAVASVNCDETLVATYLYRSSGATDYAAGSGAPPDATPPPAPSLAGSIAGWRRAFISLKNPTVEQSEDFSRTEIWFSVGATAPTLVEGAVVNGRRIPDRDGGTVAGTFVNRGSQVVVFDSETLADPGTPTLANEEQYNLLAVSYDRCNNTSVASTDIKLIILCGDDPVGPPPSGPLNPTATSCESDSVQLGWEYPPKLIPLIDFAGYRIERTGPSGTAVTELTSGPTWLESWTDGGPLAAGGTYDYSIRATDCAYENQNALFPNNRSLPLTIGPIHPGRLEHYANDGSPLALENFVSTVSDAGRPYTYHNNVKFFLQNTSAAAQTLQRLAVTWDNPNVVLDQIVVGGSPSSTTARTIDAGGAAPGSPVTVDTLIVDRAAGVGLRSDPIPVLLRFTTPSGSVNRLTDMRGEALRLSLAARNESLDPSLCPTPRLIEFDVPQGPVIGGFSQDEPGLFGIDSYEVIGAAGTARDKDIVVPGGRLVNVYGSVFDNSRDVFADGVNRGFETLTLVSIDAPAADLGVTPAPPSTGTFVARPLQNLGGSRYAIFDPSTLSGARMPLVEDRVQWYYALAVDRTGNWDRAPNPDFGTYAYYQAGADVCTAASPSPPVLTLVSTTPGSATLSWSAPTTYDDGGTIPPTDTLSYVLSYNHDGGAAWTPGSEQSGTSLTFSGDMANQAWYFMVKAKNSCAASPKVSLPSNIVRECEGAFGVYCPTFAVTPAAAAVGAAITVAAPDICMFKGNGSSGDAVIFRVTSTLEEKSFTVPESGGDTGSFAKLFTTAAAAPSAPDQVAAAAGTTLTVGLLTSDGTLRCTGTVALIDTSGCATRPNPPSGVTTNNNTARELKLSWIAPNFNVDGTPVNLAGYEIDVAKCIAKNWGSGKCGGSNDKWEAWTTTSVGVVLSTTFTGLAKDDRYRYRIRAMNGCTPAGFSDNVAAGPARVK